MLEAAVNVHLVDAIWPGLLVNSLVGLVGALIGGLVVWKTSRDQQRVAATQALEAQRQEWERARVALSEETARAESQYRRELLARAADLLLNALWNKERELCDALHLGRLAVQAGQKVDLGDDALLALGRIDLDIYRDLISALPFIIDEELRERLRTAGVVANACMNIRATADGGTVAEFERAMIEVQRYFKWLRWNLSLALQGETLPHPVQVPNVRRPLTTANSEDTLWTLPVDVPDYT